MSKKTSSYWGKMALLNTACASWLIYDMATATEAPSRALALLQYFLLALSSTALVGSVVYFFRIGTSND